MLQASIWERDGTLGAIEHLLSAALEGRGSSLFIVGEAGLGKTTMLERAQQAAASRFSGSRRYRRGRPAFLRPSNFSKPFDRPA
ncbi:MAG: ATP-binding protein [Chloroflexi bacterium]|nr:MAG: ATP-binding protein [Chloroflexota bacterium]